MQPRLLKSRAEKMAAPYPVTVDHDPLDLSDGLFDATQYALELEEICVRAGLDSEGAAGDLAARGTSGEPSKSHRGRPPNVRCHPQSLVQCSVR